MLSSEVCERARQGDLSLLSPPIPSEFLSGTDSFGCSLAYHACHSGQVELVAALVSAGAVVTEREFLAGTQAVRRALSLLGVAPAHGEKGHRRQQQQPPVQPEGSAGGVGPGPADVNSSREVFSRLIAGTSRKGVDFHVRVKPHLLTSEADELALWGALAMESCPLTSIDLRKLELGPSFAGLADALRTNTRIHTMYLYKNVIGDERLAMLMDALAGNRTLTKLNICQNGLTAGSALILSRNLGNLAYLDINNNFVGDEGAGHFAEALRVGRANGLKELSLRNNGITDAGADRLASSLSEAKDHQLYVLVLDTNESHQQKFKPIHNHISPEAAKRVRDLLRPRPEKTYSVDRQTMAQLFK